MQSGLIVRNNDQRKKKKNFPYDYIHNRIDYFLIMKHYAVAKAYFRFFARTQEKNRKILSKKINFIFACSRVDYMLSFFFNFHILFDSLFFITLIALNLRFISISLGFVFIRFFFFFWWIEKSKRSDVSCIFLYNAFFF